MTRHLLCTGVEVDVSACGIPVQVVAENEVELADIQRALLRFFPDYRVANRLDSWYRIESGGLAMPLRYRF